MKFWSLYLGCRQPNSVFSIFNVLLKIAWYCPFNSKMPLIAFSRDASCGLIYSHCMLRRFLNHKFLKLFSPRNLNIALQYVSENVMTGADRYISDSHVIQGYLYFLCIYCITLFEIIPEIVFGKRNDWAFNSFIQKDCMIVYRCVTGNHTGNYFLITPCLSVTFPPRIVVLKLWNKAWFLRQNSPISTVLTVKCSLHFFQQLPINYIFCHVMAKFGLHLSNFLQEKRSSTPPGRFQIMLCSKVSDKKNSKHAVHFKSANQRFVTAVLQMPKRNGHEALIGWFKMDRMLRIPLVADFATDNCQNIIK